MIQPTMQALRFGGRAIACGTIAAALAAALPTNARAQDPLTKIELNDLKTSGAAAGEMLDKFRKHYEFVLAEMGSPDHAAGAHKLRKDVRKDLQALGTRANDRQTLHGELNKLLLAQLPARIADNAQAPAARVNWTLLLGELDEVEPQSTIRPDGAKALAQAAGPLLDIYSSADKYPVDVRVAALSGLLRHVDFGMSPAGRQQVAGAAVQILSQDKPPADMAPEIHDYLRRRTVALLHRLIVLGPEGDNTAAAAALHKFASSPDVRLLYRCEAAHALGAVSGKNLPAADVPAMLNNLSDLVVETSRIAAPSGQSASSNPGATATPAADAVAAPADAAPTEAQEPKLDRKFVAYYLTCIRAGLGVDTGRGVTAAQLDAEQKAKADELRTKVDDLRKTAKNNRVRDRKFQADMQQVAQHVKKLFAPKELVAERRDGGAESGGPNG